MTDAVRLLGAAIARPSPALSGLGIDPDRLAWARSGDGAGSVEIAMPADDRGRWAPGDWVLMRVAGDPAGRILMFDRNEWECFIDGARKGEFDDAAEFAPATEQALDM